MAIEQPLLDLAELASKTVPGADGAGATLLEDDLPVYRSSNGFARAADRSQYRLGEGPCIDAVAQACTVVTGQLGAGERRWPRFEQEARALQVRSVMSLPLVVADHVIGSINLYARTPDAFTADAVSVGEQFAGPAAVSLSSAKVLLETIDVVEIAGYILADKASIETAIGALMGLHHLTAAAARQHLTTSATAAGITVKQAATRVLADLAHQSPPRP